MCTKSIASVFLLIACSAVRCLGAGPLTSGESSHIRLRLEGPSRPITVEDLVLRVALENDGPGCHPIYLDPLFSPFTLPHRGSKLTLHLYDDRGRESVPQAQYPPNVVPLTPDRLFLLDCGTLYGSLVAFQGRSMWAAMLKPGSYHVRADLEVKTSNLASQGSEFLAFLVRRHGNVASAKRALVDFTVSSNEVVFTIAPTTKK